MDDGGGAEFILCMLYDRFSSLGWILLGCNFVSHLLSVRNLYSPRPKHPGGVVVEIYTGLAEYLSVNVICCGVWRVGGLVLLMLLLD